MKKIHWSIWLAVIAGWIGTVFNENSNMGGIAWLLGVAILTYAYFRSQQK